MKTENHSEAVRRLFSAFMASDRPAAEALIADGFTFTSPYDDHIDKATYFERCWPNSHQIEEQTIESIATSGDDVFVMYHCKTRDGKSFRNAELHRLENGKIKSVTVFFGRTES